MVMLITGGEQGLGEQILANHLVLDRGKGYNIKGDDIIKAAKENRLKEFVDIYLHSLPVEPEIIINNFSINHLSWIGETTEDDKLIMDINVMLPYWVINYYMANSSKPKRVVNITSMTYKVPQRTTTLYCASKAAVNHMTKVMARELAPKGWVINNFAPGKILGTEMTRLTDLQVNSMRGWTQEEADRYAKGMVPMGRFMSKMEAAKIVRSMLTMETYINGTTIEAFGGL